MRKLYAICKVAGKAILILFLGCCLYVGIAVRWMSYVGKTYITWDSLLFDAHLCDEYKKQFGTWPSSMEQIQSSHIKLGNRGTKDAWGREVVFVPYDESVGCGKIISYGRDGKPGGTGVNLDIEIRFPAEPNVVWNKQQSMGLEKPPRQ